MTNARTLQPPQSETARNVHIYNHEGQVIGGTYQHGSITRSNLYDLCPLFLDFPSSTADQETWAIFSLCADGSRGSMLSRDQTALEAGKYIVLSRTGDPIAVRPTDRTAVRRIGSGSDSSQRLSSKQKHFRDQIRKRDQACAVTGYSRADFAGLKAAHIVPIVPRQQEVRRQEQQQQQGDHKSCVTDTGSDTDLDLDLDFTPAASMLCGEDLLSPRNGLLLSTAVHTPFDFYEWAINPMDGYKITIFHKQDTLVPIDGKVLSGKSRSQGLEDWRISDATLRWHFDQAVLKNMKGATGEEWSNWGDDLGEGCDHIAEIMKGPAPGERMELELENRLAGWTEHERQHQVS